jgi:CMP-N-acetylneuraminic acid synthetase
MIFHHFSLKDQDVVWHKRPEELSHRDSSIWETVADYASSFHQYRTNYMVLLHPTSPCLRPDTVKLALSSLSLHPVLETYISVDKVSPFSWVAGNKPDFSKAKNTQDYPPRYQLNNAFIMSTWENMMKGNIYGSRWAPYPIPADEAIDIDDETDLRMAEAILHWRQNEETPEPATRNTREVLSSDEGKAPYPIPTDGGYRAHKPL